MHASLVKERAVTHGVGNNLLLAINHILVHQVALHALDGTAFKVLDDSLELFRNLEVGRAGLHDTDSELGSGVCGLDHISGPASDGGGRRRADDNSLGGNSGVAVDVGTDLNLDHIVSLEGGGRGGVGRKGGVVADDAVKKK